ncbi:MAG: DUF481 domain-containing protein [Puniceicoccaceae bacterium]
MKSIHQIFFIPLLSVATCFSTLHADQIETTDGSILRGTITAIQDGVIKLDTPWAGIIEIQQAAATRISVESDLQVVLTDGTQTTLSASAEGASAIPANRITLAGTSVDVGENNATAATPETVAASVWKFETAVGIHGKSGNSNKQDFSGSFAAIREREKDRLEFNLRYQMSKSETAGRHSERTADEAIAKADYTSFFLPTVGWYLRETLEQDRFENLKLRSLSSAGLSWKALTTPQTSLEWNAGIALRYESYGFDLDRDGVEDRTGSTSEPGVTVGLKFKSSLTDWAEWATVIDINPIFDDFSDFRLDHVSTLDMPLGSSDRWKLRFSLAHQYNSKVPDAVDKLDTTYALSLLLQWK